ncbi:hypothetical protein ACLOJK_015117 [Asimina triloba]
MLVETNGADGSLSVALDGSVQLELLVILDGGFGFAQACVRLSDGSNCRQDDLIGISICLMLMEPDTMIYLIFHWGSWLLLVVVLPWRDGFGWCVRWSRRTADLNRPHPSVHDRCRMGCHCPDQCWVRSLMLDGLGMRRWTTAGRRTMLLLIVALLGFVLDLLMGCSRCRHQSLTPTAWRREDGMVCCDARSGRRRRRGVLPPSTSYRRPSMEWVVTVWISPAVDNGRLRSVDRSLAGDGLGGSSLERVEHRMLVLRRCTDSCTHAVY